MRRYELMLLFRPDLEDDKLQSAVEKVTRAIVNAGGTLTKVSPWGKRRMAYEIQHFREASYFLLHFDIAPSAIRDIERGLLISEEILRHLVTLLEDHGTSISEEDLAPAAVPAGESRTDDGADVAEGGDGPVEPMANRDDEAVANEVDAGADDGEEREAAEEPAPGEPNPASHAEPASEAELATEAEAASGAEPADEGDEQTEEAGRAVEA